MALRYNDQTGEFEEEGGGGSSRSRTRSRGRTRSRSSVDWGKVAVEVGKVLVCVALVATGDTLLHRLFNKGDG